MISDEYRADEALAIASADCFGVNETTLVGISSCAAALRNSVFSIKLARRRNEGILTELTVLVRGA